MITMLLAVLLSSGALPTVRQANEPCDPAKLGGCGPNPVAVPEPGVLWLGAAGLYFVRRRR